MDRSFHAEAEGLQLALDLLLAGPEQGQATAMPERMPESGMGEIQTLAMLAPLVLGQVLFFLVLSLSYLLLFAFHLTFLEFNNF
jgi:hypothetical protein